MENKKTKIEKNTNLKVVIMHFAAIYGKRITQKRRFFNVIRRNLSECRFFVCNQKFQAMRTGFYAV